MTGTTTYSVNQEYIPVDIITFTTYANTRNGTQKHIFGKQHTVYSSTVHTVLSVDTRYTVEEGKEESYMVHDLGMVR